MRPTLDDLGYLHGTDKSRIWHGYCKVYDELLTPLRDQPIRFLELGYGGYNKPRGGGESARMWRDYFTAAAVHVVEVQEKDPTCVPAGVVLHHGSQDGRRFLDGISAAGWDVVVDDASHVNGLTIRSLEYLWPHVKPGGWYLVEDLVTSYLPKYGGHPDPQQTRKPTTIGHLKGLVDDVMRQCKDGARSISGTGAYDVDRMLVTPNLIGLRKASA